MPENIWEGPEHSAGIERWGCISAAMLQSDTKRKCNLKIERERFLKHKPFRCELKISRHKNYAELFRNFLALDAQDKQQHYFIWCLQFNLLLWQCLFHFQSSMRRTTNFSQIKLQEWLTNIALWWGNLETFYMGGRFPGLQVGIIHEVYCAFSEIYCSDLYGIMWKYISKTNQGYLIVGKRNNFNKPWNYSSCNKYC